MFDFFLRILPLTRSGSHGVGNFPDTKVNQYVS